MKLLLSNGAETMTVGEFINNNEQQMGEIFEGIYNIYNVEKQLVNPFEMILFEVINSELLITRFKRNYVYDDVVYIGK